MKKGSVYEGRVSCVKFPNKGIVKVDGERKAKYKRQINMKISAAAIERLEEEGFRGPVRKRHRR